jgi:ubiquinone/menaquinone biosynthesis C-methylase UbiE
MTSSHISTLAKVYTARAAIYDDSWHPSFADHLLSVALLPPLELGSAPIHLDLACGTGLVTIPAIAALPSTAHIYGIDVSPGMLALARQKLETLPAEQQERVHFLEHDMVRLCDIPELASLEGKVDIITCASAFVLLANATERRAALAMWTRMLRPGTGRLVFDVTHEHNLRSGIVLEAVAKVIGLQSPSDRLWIENEQSIINLIREASRGKMFVERTELKEQDGKGVVKWDSGREVAVQKFQFLINNDAYAAFREGGAELLHKSRELFVDLWRKAAEPDGKVLVVDAVYIIIARKLGGTET